LLFVNLGHCTLYFDRLFGKCSTRTKHDCGGNTSAILLFILTHLPLRFNSLEYMQQLFTIVCISCAKR
jgi:hypothetical protein